MQIYNGPRLFKADIASWFSQAWSYIFLCILVSTGARATEKSRVIVVIMVDGFSDKVTGGALDVAAKNLIQDLPPHVELTVLATGVDGSRAMGDHFPPTFVLSTLGESRAEAISAIESLKPQGDGYGLRDPMLTSYQLRNNHMKDFFDSLSKDAKLLVVRFASNSPFGPLDQFAITNDDSKPTELMYSHPIMYWKSCFDRIQPFKNIPFAQMGFFALGTNSRSRECMRELNLIHPKASVVSKKASHLLKRYDNFRNAILDWIAKASEQLSPQVLSQSQSVSTNEPEQKRVQPDWFSPDSTTSLWEEFGYKAFFSKRFRLLFARELQNNIATTKELVTSRPDGKNDFIFDRLLHEDTDLYLASDFRIGTMFLKVQQAPQRMALVPEGRFLISRERAPTIAERKQSPLPGECLFQLGEINRIPSDNLKALINFALEPNYVDPEPQNFFEYARNDQWVLLTRGRFTFRPNQGYILCHRSANLSSLEDLLSLFTQHGFQMTGRAVTKGY